MSTVTEVQQGRGSFSVSDDAQQWTQEAKNWYMHNKPSKTEKQTYINQWYKVWIMYDIALRESSAQQSAQI